jgi:hypothetical protein
MSSVDWYKSLPAAQLARMANTFMDLAFAEGLAVTALDTAERRPIPSSLTPVVVPQSELDRRVLLAEQLTSAIAKIARTLLAGPDRRVLLDPLAPFERRAVEATYQSVNLVATTRYDAYVASGGLLRPLELNATIPAMQGYSDIAAEALIRTVAAERGIPRYKAQGLIARNGSNTAALLKALVSCYRARGGKAHYPLIALAARPNDAQLTELTYLARSFTSLGYPTHVTVASTLQPTPDGRWADESHTVDLVYRHIFARRIEDSWPIAAGLLHPERHHLYNQVVAQLEEKAVLAELSRAGSEPPLADKYHLSPEEVGMAERHVPWTRRAVSGPATGPTGESARDLRDLVRSSPAQFVLKPNWDYGGKAVFVGAAIEEPQARERVRATFQRDLSWRELVDTVFTEAEGAYVVQEFVEISRQPMLVCEPTGPAWRDLYVDFSAYASLGIDPPGWGGVCRFSPGRIVNILGGGGVAPLLREEVAAELFN